MLTRKALVQQQIYGLGAVLVVGVLASCGMHEVRSITKQTKPSPRPSAPISVRPNTVYVPAIDPKTGDFNTLGAQARLGEITTDGHIDNDIFQRQPTARPIQGTLAYAVAEFKVPPASYIVVRHLDSASNTNTVKSYAIVGTGVNLAHHPVLSPSQHFVAFTVGLEDRYAAYHLYVLDLQTNVLKLVSHEVFDDDTVLWSPDEKYLAFLEEWQAPHRGPFGENPFGETKDLRVMICQWRIGKTVPAIAKRDTDGGFCWTAPHRLIFEVTPSPFEDSESKTPPAIYTTDAATQASRLIIQKGEDPVVSPDGQRIAFRRLHPTDDTSALYVAQQFGRRGIKRKLIGTHLQKFPEVRWLHDNRHLLTIEWSRSGSGGRCAVKKWDIVTKLSQSIGAFIAQDIPDAVPSYPTLAMGGVSADDSALYCNLDQWVKEQPSPLGTGILKRHITLQRMNLKTGGVENVCQGSTISIDQTPPDVTKGEQKFVESFDWREGASRLP